MDSDDALYHFSLIPEQITRSQLMRRCLVLKIAEIIIHLTEVRYEYEDVFLEILDTFPIPDEILDTGGSYG